MFCPLWWLPAQSFFALSWSTQLVVTNLRSSHGFRASQDGGLQYTSDYRSSKRTSTVKASDECGIFVEVDGLHMLMNMFYHSYNSSGVRSNIVWSIAFYAVAYVLVWHASSGKESRRGK